MSVSYANNAKKLKRDLLKMQGQATTAVKEIGEISVSHFKKSFTDYGFTNIRRGRWRTRKRYAPHPLMRKSNDLINSITARRTGKYTVRVETIGVDYAAYHNEGTDRLPKRQFIGNSVMLDKRIKRKLRNIFR